MNDIMQLVGSRLDGQTLGQIAGMLGSDEAGARNAIESALPTLISGLNRNAQRGGAEALAQAIDRDHDGGLLDNLSGFLGSGPSSRDNRIVDHILGGKRSGIEQKIGQSSGLSGDAVGKLMATLAPMVMAALAKGKQSSGSGLGGLVDMLGSADRNARRQPGGSVLSGLLDGDGDGDVDISDLTKLGGGLLGKFIN